ncbi:MAG TPA: hypothetical protein V6C65_35925 [Allocoleopsis sp.]
MANLNQRLAQRILSKFRIAAELEGYTIQKKHYEAAWSVVKGNEIYWLNLSGSHLQFDDTTPPPDRLKNLLESATQLANSKS